MKTPKQRELNRKRMRARYNDPRHRMWASSYYSAKHRGLEHSIVLADIVLPKFCRYLGVEINYTRASQDPDHVQGQNRDNGPSLDRIDPSKGYVRGNVQVISDLANRMKSSATLEQLLAFATGVIREHGARNNSDVC